MPIHPSLQPNLDPHPRARDTAVLTRLMSGPVLPIQKGLR